MIEDQDRCMKLAKPVLVDFYEIWHHAFDNYQDYPTEFTAEHDDTTAANCIRAHAWTELVRRFDGKRGYKLYRIRGLNLLLYRNDLVWRLKKVNVSGRHQNYQTEQQKVFDDQLPLPGIPPSATRLTSGYQPDTASQCIERIIVSRPLARSILWASQVNLDDGGAAAWVDITPPRLSGTDRVDYRGRRR
jgi:hypothetical protein